MASFKVEGGLRLKGEITPQGAKNEALQILCAVLLTAEKVTIHKVPNIRDVNKLIELLSDMGVKVQKLGPESYTFQADAVNLDYLETQDFLNKASALRGSVMILGPLLTRFGTGKLSKPGGDKIGRRRMDTHFFGFQKLGAEFRYDAKNEIFHIDGKNLKGTYMLLDEASVTGTANIVMAAVMAEGKTTIYNAACEPYLQQLCDMLNRMGAQITGVGSNLLHIEGVKTLGGTTHTLLPDMIEIGSFIGMAAMTQSEITIKDCQIHRLGIIPDTFRRMGIHLADLLSIILVTATQAKGTVLVHQKMFESRLFFVDKLIDMGAQIILCDPHRATVIGLDRKYPLRGIKMTSPDIRAGVALLIAALSATGTSVIDNIEQIDRGYQNIDERLNALGAKITRVD